MEMTEEQHRHELANALQTQQNSVVAKLNVVFGRIPELSKTVCIDILVPQEVDGSFEVSISVDGPDLYVLNKQIVDVANVFVVNRTSEGFVPFLPLVEEADYDVYPVVCECALQWIQSLWNEVKHQHVQLPVVLSIADDFGEFSPVKLK